MFFVDPVESGIPPLDARVDTKITFVTHQWLGHKESFVMFTIKFESHDDRMDRPFVGYYQIVKANGISVIVARLFPRVFYEKWANGLNVESE
ncbi:MAG: hypothetical protein IT292_05370 [Deltaproteobacteria bacterium]|nr:hypothetical protein [Deltaproteobacteria bacterium]